MVQISTEHLFPSSPFGKLCEDNQGTLFEILISVLEAFGLLDKLLRKAHSKTYFSLLLFSGETMK